MFTKQTMLRAAVLVAIAASTSLFAKADTLDFTITGHGTDITFSLPSNPTLSGSLAGQDFQLNNVTLDVNGTDVVGDDLEFFTTSQGGGLADVDGLLGEEWVLLNQFGLYGAQLFSGGVSDPTFSGRSGLAMMSVMMSPTTKSFPAVRIASIGDRFLAERVGSAVGRTEFEGPSLSEHTEP